MIISLCTLSELPENGQEGMFLALQELFRKDRKYLTYIKFLYSNKSRLKWITRNERCTQNIGTGPKLGW